VDIIYDIKQLGVEKFLFNFNTGNNTAFLFVMTNPWTAETKTGELPSEGVNEEWILTVVGSPQAYEDLCSGEIYFDLLGLYEVKIYKDFISDVNLVATVGFQVIEGLVVTGEEISAPTNLVSSAVSDSQIDLSWTDNSGGLFSFQVERSLDINGPFILIDTTPIGQILFSDTGLDSSTEYFYRIRATDGQGDFSEYSNIASDTTLTVNWVPSDDPNTVFWLDQLTIDWKTNLPQELITFNEVPAIEQVSSIEDKIINTESFSQSVSDDQPQVEELGGIRWINNGWQGSNAKWLEYGSYPFTNNGTETYVQIVCQKTLSTIDYAFAHAVNNSAYINLRNNANGRFQVTERGSTQTFHPEGTFVATLNEYMIVALETTPTLLNVYVNGVLDSSAPRALIPYDNTFVEMLYDNYRIVSPGFWRGDTGNFVGYQGIISQAVREQFEGQAAAAHGLDVLPVGHPYKLIPPMI